MSDLNWRRASFCGGGGNNCVEIAKCGDDHMAVRDSVFPERSFRIDAAAFAAFVDGLAR